MSNALQFLKPAAMGKSLTGFFLTSADEMAGSTFIKRAPGSPKQAQAPRGYAYRRLNRFKTVNGKRYQLHATRGWKCVGRVS